MERVSTPAPFFHANIAKLTFHDFLSCNFVVAAYRDQIPPGRISRHVDFMSIARCFTNSPAGQVSHEYSCIFRSFDSHLVRDNCRINPNFIVGKRTNAVLHLFFYFYIINEELIHFGIAASMESAGKQKDTIKIHYSCKNIFKYAQTTKPPPFAFGKRFLPYDSFVFLFSGRHRARPQPVALAFNYAPIIRLRISG